MNPRNEMLNLIEAAMTAIVSGNTDAALAPLWKVHVQLRESALQPSAPVFTPSMDDIYGAPTKNLPPMKPIKKVKKRIGPNTVIKSSCPRCGAKAGDPCFGFTNAGRNGVVDTSKIIATFHMARQEKARR